MDEFNNILNSTDAELLAAIPKFQTDILENFIQQTNNDYIIAADLWLNSSPANTAKFGGEEKQPVQYREMLIGEIEKFLCGDEAYSDERNKITESADKSQKYIIGVMSAALGKSLGVAGSFIAPVVVLALMSFGKMAINAWCEMRKVNK
jgi:hypothetical protein